MVVEITNENIYRTTSVLVEGRFTHAVLPALHRPPREGGDGGSSEDDARLFGKPPLLPQELPRDRFVGRGGRIDHEREA